MCLLYCLCSSSLDCTFYQSIVLVFSNFVTFLVNGVVRFTISPFYVFFSDIYTSKDFFLIHGAQPLPILRFFIGACLSMILEKFPFHINHVSSHHQNIED